MQLKRIWTKLSGMSRLCLVVGVVLAAGACRRESAEPPRPPPSGDEAWLLSGTADERFARVARQLRGFDVAMVETGYRYGELYWAGQDRNWAYAKYQVDKMRTAVRNGLERRPKRAQSARVLDEALPGVEAAIQAGDPALFAERFERLTATCNACHEAEAVAFMHVRPPATRSSPVGAPPAEAPH